MTQLPGRGHRRVTVFAANAFLSITLERNPAGEDEIHLHPAGQGVWVARMIHRLGEEATIRGAIGGEPGLVFEGLLRAMGLALQPVRVSAPTAAYVHDRRSGERRLVASGRTRPLSRHELDDLYETVLAGSAADGMVVVTGRADDGAPPASFYRRLGADLAAAGVTVVGDLHGPELCALLEGGPVAVLKVSDEDLTTDGERLVGEADIVACAQRLRAAGAGQVVVSRADAPTVALWDDGLYSATAPHMSSADHRGAGDAMTGALAVALLRGLPAEDALALGCGAGAAAVTRRGLATADVRLIAELTARTTIRRLPDGHAATTTPPR